MTFNRRLLVSLLFSLAAAPIVVVTGVLADHEIVTSDGSGDPIRGSGRLVSQSRAVDGFDAIDLHDSSDVEIVIGSPTKVTVQADDNVVDLVRTEVRGNTLVIDSKGSFHTWHGPRVQVQMPAITALHINGSGDVALRGVANEHLNLGIEGSGDLNVDGDVGDVRLVIAGSGDARLGSLKARSASVEIDGSGDADVYASEALVATVNGSGDIVYRGDPAHVETSTHGSGDIQRR